MNFSKTLIFIISLSIISFATDIPTTTNVNSTITFSVGSKTTSETFTGGTKKTVSLPWLVTTSTVTIKAISNDDEYLDTSYTTEIKVTNSSYPPWEAKAYQNGAAPVSHKGKDWQNKWYAEASDEPGVSAVWGEVGIGEIFELIISLPHKPYPADTAYIPVRGNKDFTLKAIPIAMIEGSTPSLPFVFNISANTIDTIRIPVKTNMNMPIKTSFNIIQNTIKTYFTSGTMRILLPSSINKGFVNVISLNGRKIAQMDLRSSIKNSLSVWNVSAGVYIMQILSKNGSQKTQKFNHIGGDIHLVATFHPIISNNSIAIDTKSRINANTAQYRFECNVTDAKYNDTTITYEFLGQMNDYINYYFINPNSMASVFGQLVDSTTYQTLFPNRFGLGYGAYISTPLPEDPTKIIKLDSDGDYDFFTYESLIMAIDNMSEVEVEIYQLVGHAYMHRLVWRNKITGVTHGMVNNEKYESFKATNTETLVSRVDYANFCNEGNLATRKQELAAFFGNISHETTGGRLRRKIKNMGIILARRG